MLDAPGGDDPGGDAAREEGRRAQTGVNVRQPHGAFQVARDLALQDTQPGAVTLAHPAQVPREVATFDEAGEHRLRDRRRIQVGLVAQRQDPVDPGVRRDHVAEPQRRKQHLVEGAEHEDRFAAGEPPHGGERRAAVPELAVVVVLDERGAGLFRPAQEVGAPRGRQRRAQAELVRRREVHRGRAGAAPPADRGIEPVFIHSHRDDPRSRVAEDLHRAAVAGILDPDRLAGPNHQPGDEIEALLHAREDHDVVGGTGDAARRAQIAGDRFAQGPRAGRVAAGERADPQPAEHPARDPRPGRHRELVQRRLDRTERPNGAHRGTAASRGRDRGVGDRQEVLGHLRRDGGARPHPADDVALLAQLLERGHDHPARDPMALRQIAGGGQSSPSGQPPGQNRRAHLLVEPADDGLTGAPSPERERNLRCLPRHELDQLTWADWTSPR